MPQSPWCQARRHSPRKRKYRFNTRIRMVLLSCLHRYEYPRGAEWTLWACVHAMLLCHSHASVVVCCRPTAVVRLGRICARCHRSRNDGGCLDGGSLSAPSSCSSSAATRQSSRTIGIMIKTTILATLRNGHTVVLEHNYRHRALKFYQARLLDFWTH